MSAKYENFSATDLPCLCALLRKAGRVATRQYDAALRNTDLRITQFSLLININQNRKITVSILSELMRMDQTTVTRNLKVLEKRKLIRLVPAENDQRIRQIHMTKSGRKLIKQTLPFWESAQKDMIASIGVEQARHLVQSLATLIKR